MEGRMRATPILSRAALSLGLAAGAAGLAAADSPWTTPLPEISAVAAPGQVPTAIADGAPTQQPIPNPPRALPPVVGPRTVVPAAPAPGVVPAAPAPGATSQPCNCGCAGNGGTAPCQSCGCPQTCPPRYDGSCFERSVLTGDWCGLRSDLRCSGITFNASVTQYFQGVTSGGLDHNTFYGGRGDYYINLDGDKLGLWKGFFVNLHGETRYGESANAATGALFPTNLGLYEPVPTGSVTALTEVKFGQYLSDNFVVYFGKLNALDEYQQPLNLGGMTDGFWNGALAFNPILARTVPYSTLAVGGAYVRCGEPILSLTVYDANNTPTTSGFNDFFNHGVTVVGQANFTTHLLGLPGRNSLVAAYSSRAETVADPSPYYTVPPVATPGFRPDRQSSSWSLSAESDQMLVVSSCDPKRGWGVFGASGISDGNPNVVQWYTTAGVGGSSPLRSRPNDTFGIGYYYLSLRDSLKDRSTARDERGLEMFYNIAVTPWCHITPDFQVITPVNSAVEASVLFGVRAKLDF
jgi:porin